jgi:PAT family beta-lactamase induction signal transducer AmpG
MRDATHEPPEPRRGSTPLFVGLLYFQQGAPAAIIQNLTVTLYKRLGLANDELTFLASLLRLPWVLKPLLAPWVESRGTLRAWVVGCQFVIAWLLGLSAAAVLSDHALVLTMTCFGLAALCSTLHDIAADGFYMQALSPAEQALWVGLRSAGFRLALVFGTGGLVWLAGVMEGDSVDVRAAWAACLGAGAMVFLGGALAVTRVLPHPAARARATHSGEALHWRVAVTEYVRQPRFPAVLLFILLYRFGESMISTMSPPFLLDGAEAGGLGLATSDAGLLVGTVGVVALTAGGLLGGVVIDRVGLRRALWPMVLCMNVPNLFYVWAAADRPGLGLAGVLVAVDQFGYGFGFSAYMVFLLAWSRNTLFPTSSYAISSALMALSAVIAGACSGVVQVALGYQGFFIVVCACAIPGMATLFFVPAPLPAPRGPGPARGA